MIEPVLHRLILKQDLLEEKDEVFASAKKAGLHIPRADEFSREQAGIDTGTVVAIGSTAFRDFGAEAPVQIGDYVSFARHAGKVLVDPDDEDGRYVAINDEDVIARITKKGA